MNCSPSPLPQVRRINLIRDIQRKLEKQQRLLHDEEEALGGVNYPEYPGDLLPMDSEKQTFRCEHYRLHYSVHVHLEYCGAIPPKKIRAATDMG